MSHDFPNTRLSMLESMMRGSNEAWISFDGLYRETMIRWCRNRGLAQKKDESRAEDIAQEISMRLLKQLPKFDQSRGAFRSWLKTIVNNAITDYFRKSGDTKFAEGDDEFVSMLNDKAAVDEICEELEVRGETLAAQVLERVISRVGEDTWSRVIAVTQEGRKREDVANEFGVTIGTIDKNLYRVRKCIQEELENAEGKF